MNLFNFHKYLTHAEYINSVKQCPYYIENRHFCFFMNLKRKKSECNLECKCRKQPISFYNMYLSTLSTLMIPKILKHKPKIYF